MEGYVSTPKANKNKKDTDDDPRLFLEKAAAVLELPTPRSNPRQKGKGRKKHLHSEDSWGFPGTTEGVVTSPRIINDPDNPKRRDSRGLPYQF